MRHSRVIAGLSDAIWAVSENKFREIVAFVQRLEGRDIEARAPVAQGRRQEMRTTGSVAVLPLFGVISQRANLLTEFSGGTSTQLFSRDFRAALDDSSVKTILIEVDSPGGATFGVSELFEEIFQARSKKRIVAHVNSLAASAAFWIASAAHEIVITPGGFAGSIGVFALHQDLSKRADMLGISPTFISAGRFKTEGHEFAPLDDEAHAAIQGQVDAVYGQFVSAVARGRGVRPGAVRNGFGQGRVLSAGDSLAEGLIDKVATFENAVEAAGKRPLRPRAAGRAGLSSRNQPPAARSTTLAERRLDLRRRKLELRKA